MNSDILERFLNGIWGNNEGLVHLPNRTAGKWTTTYFRWPEHRQAILKYVASKTAAQCEVYFAPAIFKEEALVSGPTIENVKGTQVLWADFDGNAPLDWSMVKVVSEPTFRVQTSTDGNEHAYWVLDKFVEDKEFIESKNRAIAYSLGADTACWNVNRLLRPPLGINFGYAKPERNGKKYDVDLIEFSDKQYPPEDFKDLPHVRLLVKKELVSAELPSIPEVMMQCSWTPSLSDLFTKNVEELLVDPVKGLDRSKALVSLAMQAAEIGWTDVQIYTIICDADERWGKYKDRSDRDLQRSNIVEHARRKHPSVAEDLTFAGLLTGDIAEINPRVIYTYGEFRRLEIKINFIFKDLLAAQGFGIVFGPSGVGKTQLGIQFCRSVACGEDFLNWENVTKEPKRVMMFSLEMGPAPLKLFTDKMEKNLTPKNLELISNNMLIVPLGEALSLSRPEGRRFFEDLIKEHRPDVLFIDSLGTMTMGSLKEDEPAREMLVYIQRIRKAFNCSVFVIHHANKANSGPNLTLQDFFGSTYLFTGTDFVLGMSYNDKEDSSALRITSCKMRLGPLLQPFTILRDEHLTFTLEGEANPIHYDNPGGGSTGDSPPVFKI